MFELDDECKIVKYTIITGLSNGPVLFCSMASVGVVCRRL